MNEYIHNPQLKKMLLMKMEPIGSSSEGHLKLLIGSLVRELIETYLGLILKKWMRERSLDSTTKRRE